MRVAEPGPIRCAVLGAGPVGLEAALYAAVLGMDVAVHERGEEIAASVRDWGHVRMFSPFGMNRSPLGAGLLAEAGHDLTEDGAYQSGAEYVENYLRPLAELPLLAGRVELGARLVSVGKDGLVKGDLIGRKTRLESPFRLLIQGADGAERISRADVVLDCTGMYASPNWLGNGGIPAMGERALRGRISYRLPDALGADRRTYAGKTTLLAGGGYSAATTLLGLLALSREAPGTRVVWLTNRDDPRLPVIADDPLPRRAALTEEANRIAADGDANLVRVSGGSVEGIRATGDEGFRVSIGTGPAREVAVDRVVANVGYAPDNSLYSELQVHECYASRGPMNLAAALLAAGGDGNDCLAVPPLGAATLGNPEPGFFILGSKSYGKGFNFLLKTGLEQIRDAFTLISGRPELDLYRESPRRTPGWRPSERRRSLEYDRYDERGGAV